jgi:hypothetical protein
MTLSSVGVFCVFLMKAWSRTIVFSLIVKSGADDAVWQATANFPETVANAANERHSQRPSELHGFNIFPDDAPLGWGEGL